MEKSIEERAMFCQPELARKQLGWTREKFCKELNITIAESLSWTEGKDPTLEQKAKINDLLREQQKNLSD